MKATHIAATHPVPMLKQIRHTVVHVGSESAVISNALLHNKPST